MFNLRRERTESNRDSGASLFSIADVAETRRASAKLQACLSRGRHERFAEEIELTPALAEILLASNPDNRRVSDAVVDRYATDIREGNWKLNGETIKVSADGLLNDGQHRCSAVAKAGRSIHTIIIFGVDRDSRLTIDQGKIRTPGEYLGMQGVPDGNHAAAVAKLIWQFNTYGLVSSSSHFAPTKSQIQEAFKTNPTILDSVRAIPKRASLVGGTSVLAFCHFMFAKRDVAAAKYFIDRLVKGNGLNEGEPIFLARERLLADRRMPLSDKVELLFRAWNLHRRGERGRTKLQLTRTKLPPLAR